ncbi:protein kinase brain isozyme, partial [Chrysochromulina tobinii]
EAKKLRLASKASGEGLRDSGAVIPPEPDASVVDGRRSCCAPSDFAILCMLGKGAFGRVALMRWRGDGRPYAMKTVRLDSLATDKMAIELVTERRVLTELSEAPHARLAYARCCFRSAKHLHFVMEFLQGGSLARLLDEAIQHQTQPGLALPEPIVRYYAAQLVLALGALHSRGMLYLDLKLENVILNARGDAKLVDFGFVRCDVDVGRLQAVKRAGGTRCYLAPEAILGLPVSAPCDWWALGVLVYELLVGYGPFRGDNDKALGAAICNSRLRFPRHCKEDDEDEDLPAGAPAAASPFASPSFGPPRPSSASSVTSNSSDGDFVRKLLTKKAEARLGTRGADECRAHPFLRSLDWAALEAGTLESPYVPVLSGETDVRYFARKFTSCSTPTSASEVGAGVESDVVVAQAEAAQAAAARKAELKEQERKLAEHAEAEAKAALAAKAAAASLAATAAKDAAVELATDAASEAAKKLRASQKKLRQATELL